MTFQIKSDKKDSETKSIRFPKKLIERIEAAIQERDVTFTGFVVQACEYALDNMTEEDSQGYRKNVMKCKESESYILNAVKI